LCLRGYGETLGTKQSGRLAFRLANLDRHGDLLPVAAADVRRIAAENPELSA